MNDPIITETDSMKYQFLAGFIAGVLVCATLVIVGFRWMGK